MTRSQATTIAIFMSVLCPGLAVAQSFVASAGFSTTQGANQWSYFDSDGVPMVHDAVYNGGAWHSPTPTTSPAGDWCYVSPTQQHPGPTKDAIRRWTAPTTGTISITGSSRMTASNGGDGAIVYIKKNDAWIHTALVPANDWKIGKSWALTSITVMAGDVIDTGVNRYGTYNGDEQRISQTIQYTPQPLPYVSSDGFSATQGANQWSYLDGDQNPMVFGSTYAGGAWQSTASGGPDWCYVSRNHQHPGTNATTRDSIRRWTAPHTGVVTITGNSRMSGFNGGDGAHVFVRRNGLQLYGGFVAPNDFFIGRSWTLTSAVTAGDKIDTVVNRGQTYWGDEQILTQTITYNDPQVIAAPSSGYALRLSTINLPGPQADATRVVNGSLADLSPPTVTPQRFAPANPTTIVAYVASNIAGADQPKRVMMTGTVRQICEGLRGSGGQAGAYTETVSQIDQDNNAVAAQGSLSKSWTLHPSSYACAPGLLLRRLVVEVQATAVKANGAAITTPLARFTLVSRLKVMSWNIRGGFNVGAAQTGTTMASIGALIVSEKVDVAVLQEVNVNFNADSGYLDEMAILRSHLAPIGLTSDHFQPRCDRGNPVLSADGMAIFSRFPSEAVHWQQLAVSTGHCAGGWFNTYDQKFGIQTMTIALGGDSLVLGNTHMFSRAPNGFTDDTAGWVAAGTAFWAANEAAMVASPYTFLMSGDYNSGPIPSSPFVKLVDHNTPGMHSVHIPFPSYDFIDHMFYRPKSPDSAVPIESYFRHWDHGFPIGTFNPPLSDHLPRLTIYEVR